MPPLRDITIVAVVGVLLPFCLTRPWIGVLAWSWLSYMSPHRLAWGFSTSLPLAQAVAVATLLGFLFHQGRKRLFVSAELVLLLTLFAWFTVTSSAALYPDEAWTKWSEFAKALLMALLTIPLFQDRRRLRVLLLVVAGSIAFFGFKGGIFALVTGGEWMILGPEGSFLAANTELALGMNMILPLLVAVAREETRRSAKVTLRCVIVLTAIAVPFTYSRGGVLGLLVVLALLFVSARGRWILLPVCAAALIAFISFAPQQWTERMETMRTYESDESAQLRFMSWDVAYRIAQDHPLTGGGFRVLTHREIYDRYLPEYPRAFGHDAHSIYFNLLAEHGWPGLAIFAALIGSTLMTLHRLRKRTRAAHGDLWISNYATAIQISLIAWLLNGAFLSVAYFDLAYHLIIITVVLKAMAVTEPIPAMRPGRVLKSVSLLRLRRA